MAHRVPTIFEVAEQAERQQKKAQPQAGARKLQKAVRKASGKTSRHPKPKQKTPRK
jgi:hypothetical protein